MSAEVVNTLGTNPWPFILGAYLIGLVLTGGYAIWAARENKRLQLMLSALRGDKPIV